MEGGTCAFWFIPLPVHEGNGRSTWIQHTNTGGGFLDVFFGSNLVQVLKFQWTVYKWYSSGP